MILMVIITAESQDRTYIQSTSRHHIVKYTIPPASKHRQKNNNREKKKKRNPSNPNKRNLNDSRPDEPKLQAG